MASLERTFPGLPGVYARPLKKGDLAYYVTLRGRDGIWFRRNVGRHSRGMRPKLAAARQQELQREVDRNRDPAIMGATTFHQAFENFLLQKQANGSDITRDINRWDLYLAPLGNIPLSRLDTRDFNELLISMRRKGLSDGYLEKVFGQARTIIAWAIKADLWDGKNPLGRDSTFRMPAWRKSAKPSRWFTAGEAQRLLKEVRSRSEDLYRMSLLSLNTGMRAMEIWSLGELEDALDRDNGVLNFFGKSGEREYVYATDEIFDLLEQYRRQPGELIFQMQGSGGRVYKTSKSFRAAIEAAGLASRTHKVWFHSWRHTFGSWLAQSGEFTLHEIMEYMRHSDDRMTRHYAKLIPGDRRERLGLIREKLAGVVRQEPRERSQSKVVRFPGHSAIALKQCELFLLTLVKQRLDLTSLGGLRLAGSLEDHARQHLRGRGGVSGSRHRNCSL